MWVKKKNPHNSGLKPQFHRQADNPSLAYVHNAVIAVGYAAGIENMKPVVIVIFLNMGMAEQDKFRISGSCRTLQFIQTELDPFPMAVGAVNPFAFNNLQA